MEKSIANKIYNLIEDSHDYEAVELFKQNTSQEQQEAVFFEKQVILPTSKAYSEAVQAAHDAIDGSRPIDARRVGHLAELANKVGNYQTYSDYVVEVGHKDYRPLRGYDLVQPENLKD